MKINSLQKLITSLCALSLLAQFAFAQTPAKPPAKPFELTVDSIMRGPRLVGYQPSGVYWSQDSQRVYFRWKQADEPRLKEMSLYVINRDGTGLRRLSDEEAKQAPPATGDLSKDKTMTVFTDEGDIFIYDHAKQARRQITRTVDAETNARFTFDQKRIYFTRTNNLYVMSLEGGSLEQLTDIRIGALASPSSTPRGTDSQEYLKKEERALIDAVRERAEQREEQEKKRKEREKRKPFSIPIGQNVLNLNLSPDGKYVIATISEPATGAKNIIVPNYVTESAYTEDIPGRSKVGDMQGRTRLVIIDVESGETKNVDHGQKQPAAPAVQRTEMNTTEQAQRERGEASVPRAVATGSMRKQSRLNRKIATYSSRQSNGPKTERTRRCWRARPTTKIVGCCCSIRRRAKRKFSLQSMTMRGLMGRARTRSDGCPTTRLSILNQSVMAGRTCIPFRRMVARPCQLTSGAV